MVTRYVVSREVYERYINVPLVGGMWALDWGNPGAEWPA